MTKNEKIVIIASATYLVAGSAIYLNHRRNERKKRAEIDAEVKQEINAIRRAAIIVNERIKQGYYRNIDDVMNDFAFERIAIRTEE